jgi:FAD/FMN-containing dehydrogenase
MVFAAQLVGSAASRSFEWYRGGTRQLKPLFEQASDLIRDGVIAQSAQQAQDLWSLRETIPLANRAIGAICSSDISLPLSEIAGFIAKMPATLGPFWRHPN